MRLMGAKPSHSTLEVALLTKPNFVILAEEVKEKNMTLADIVKVTNNKPIIPLYHSA